jgi:catechol 2,3-dioxygenase
MGDAIDPGVCIGHAHLKVSDLERSLAFYCGVLGFEIMQRWGAEAAFISAGGYHHHIGLNTWESAGGPPPAPGTTGLYHVAILLPDRAALGRFLAHLVRIGARLGASDHLVSEALYLRDPDGLGIEVYADRPRSTWRWANGELAMATEPLDTASVIAAGRGEPWTGMPAGTVMGHLHLHVGDIGTASRFYHDALGLDPTVWSYPGALFLSAGGYHHHLGVNTWAGRAASASDDEARMLEWRMIVPTADDANAAADRVRAAGHDVAQTSDGWLAGDPWGTRLRLATG